MRYGYALPVAGVCLCFMASCASPPTLVYKTFPANGETKSSIVKAGKGSVKEPATTQPTDPADSEFAMAKQVSTVVLSMPGAVAKAKKDKEQQEASVAKGDPNDIKGSDSGKHKKDEPAPPAPRPAEPIGDLEATSLDVATHLTCSGTDKDGWAHCFDGVQTTTAPHVDMNYIFAVRQGKSTSLDVTTGEHPLQVTAVTSKWTNTTAAMLAKIGSNATLGYAAGGPIGAAVVVIGGVVFRSAGSDGKKIKIPDVSLDKGKWNNAVNEHYLCQGEDTKMPDLKASLLLPVAFDLDNSLPTDDTSGAADYAGCWHRFPQGDGPYTNQAWLYRVLDWTEADSASVKDPTVQLVPPVLDERKPGASADKLGIIKSDGTSGLISQAQADAIAKASPDEAWIPASACHAVRLQVTRAEEIVAASGQNRPAGHHDVKQFKDFDIVIADPRWNQLMRVTKGTRTITFGLCGGTAKGTQGSSEISDDIKAAAELVKTVKGLQSSSGKSGQ